MRRYQTGHGQPDFLSLLAILSLVLVGGATVIVLALWGIYGLIGVLS